jgi:hypothetical protein
MARRKYRQDDTCQGLQTYKMTWLQLLSSKPFHSGVFDAVCGKPSNVDAWGDAGGTEKQWSYERGRMFAVALMAEKRPIPPLPRRGDKKEDYMPALRAASQLYADKVML